MRGRWNDGTGFPVSAGPPRFSFLFPGDPDTPTGGFVYGRRIVTECGRLAEVVVLPAEFPFPSDAAVEAADRALAGLPEGRVTVVDGLAFGVLPDIVARHAGRLRLVALVHHPLTDETGLDAATAARLKDSSSASKRTGVSNS